MGAVRKDGRYFVKRILLYMLILALAAVMLVPFLWMISASLKLNKDVFTYPVKWIPEKLEWSNYMEGNPLVAVFQKFCVADDHHHGNPGIYFQFCGVCICEATF